MERRVKFESNVQEKLPRDPQRGPAGPRKAAISVGEPKTGKDQKQPIPFEEFLRRKSNKPPVPTRNKPEAKTNRKPATAGDAPSEAGTKKVNGILRDKSPNQRAMHRSENEETENRPYGLEPPRERSLENIFSADNFPGSRSESFKPAIPVKEETYTRPSEQRLQQQETMAVVQAAQLNNGSVIQGQNNSMMKDEVAAVGKAIRGYFKKELYGEDANKREAQARMKRELEEQMEAKKARKEAEDTRIKAEEAREAEKHARYLEKQREKQQDEERKEQEKKRNREMFAQQQIAVLGEFQNQVNQEKKFKRNKLGMEEDQSSQHAPIRYAVSTASTQQAASPPTVAFNEQPRPGNTPSSLQTTSNPVEKDLMENLLKENQGLKEAANRNNIILDFLTDVLVKKQQLQISGSTVSPQVQTQLSIQGRDDYQTVDGTIQSNTGATIGPQRGRNPNKPFRINTPLTNPQGSFNLGRAAWRPQLNSGPSEYRSSGAQEQVYQPNWSSNGQAYNPGPPRKLKSSSPTQANPFPVGFAKPNTGSYTRPEYYNAGPVEAPHYGTGGGQVASSLMEEFQDINNFKMLSEEDPQATYFGYDRPDEQQFEEELNVDRRGVRQGNQGIRGDNISPQRNYDVRARGPEQRKPPYTMNDDQYHPTYNNYKGGGGYLNPVSAVEHEYVEQQFFPPGKFDLDLVNHRTDIKARSEKYKYELASKLTRIKNELNMNDSKIDNLLQKIGAGS